MTLEIWSYQKHPCLETSLGLNSPEHVHFWFTELVHKKYSQGSFFGMVQVSSWMSQTEPKIKDRLV